MRRKGSIYEDIVFLPVVSAEELENVIGDHAEKVSEQTSRTFLHKLLLLILRKALSYLLVILKLHHLYSWVKSITIRQFMWIR
ncbi:hypothetical protein CS542_00605 [Pedobacter sp. IW39]|nr:hypothetical protein CS542_00605 [Pedobacter sp. IW39]